MVSVLYLVHFCTVHNLGRLDEPGHVLPDLPGPDGGGHLPDIRAGRARPARRYLVPRPPGRPLLTHIFIFTVLLVNSLAECPHRQGVYAHRKTD
jgi:hypothetical protein